MKAKMISLAAILALANFSTARTWVHPGTLDGKAELDYVKTQVALKAAPYMLEIQTLKNNEGGLAKAPAPQTTFDANSGNADAARDDARRAYGNALMWYLTDSVSYANQAVAYLNAWSGLQSITANNDQNKLVAGWIGSLWAPTADLMLGYSGWAAADVANFRAMFKRAFYPLLNTMSTWNGNVDLHQTSAIMAIAVFNEDSTEFNLGITRLAARIPAYFYLKSDGALPAGIAGDNGNVTTFWSSPTSWVDGLTQETCRDNDHHAQFALSGSIGAMETAWHQGVDLYATYKPRMVAMLELMGLQVNSGSMQNTCANNTSTTDVYDTWEIGYNHYHVRMGQALPNTLAMITNKVRSATSNGGSWNIFYETLTHANIMYGTATSSSSTVSSSSATSLVNSLGTDAGISLLWNSNQISVQATHYPVELQIINAVGKIDQVNTIHNALPLRINNLHKGVYIVRVSGQGIATQQVIYKQ